MIEKSHSEQAREAEFVAFRAGGLEFCINIMTVREIRGWTPATAIPRAPSYIRGVINLRGVVLPIVDLGVRLGLPAVEPTARHVIIVAQVGERAAGLLVDSVSDTIIENVNSGIDQVFTSSDYTLAANVEHLTATSAAGLALTGNSLDNSIIGGAGADTLTAGGGNDTLIGGQGNDVYNIVLSTMVLTENFFILSFLHDVFIAGAEASSIWVYPRGSRRIVIFQLLPVPML